MEASSKEEKCKWILLIHFAKSRLDTNSVLEEDDTGRNAVKNSDFLLVATEKISNKSNKTIDQLFVNMENGK